MKLNKVIENTAELLCIDAPRKSKNWDFLFRCANLTLSNIFYNYNGLVTRDTFTGGSNKVSDFIGELNINALIFGIMTEYASISGLHEDAKTYNRKFELAIFPETKGRARVIKGGVI
jgi:hypothetical protein